MVVNVSEKFSPYGTEIAFFIWMQSESSQMIANL